MFAALAVMDVIYEENLVENAKAVGGASGTKNSPKKCADCPRFSMKNRSDEFSSMTSMYLPEKNVLRLIFD